MEERFRLYDIVTVVSADPELSMINGKEGVILSERENEDGSLVYGVLVKNEGHVWSLSGNDLRLTGRARKP